MLEFDVRYIQKDLRADFSPQMVHQELLTKRVEASNKQHAELIVRDIAAFDIGKRFILLEVVPV